MRTFRLSLAAAAMAASLAAPSLVSAQRNSRRSSSRATIARPDASGSATSPTSATSLADQHCASDCGDYSLAVVSAVLPSETAGGTSDVVTLVIENRGTVEAPLSLISVAPRNHMTLARQSSIPALHPGERTTVQLPVEIAADGTPCIAITITSAPVPAPAVARFLAAAIPDPNVEIAASRDWGMTSSWGYSSPFGDVGFFGDFDAMGDL